MLTEKDYCDYETCVALKELGFNNLVDWYFNEEKSIVSSLARYRNTYIPRISLYEAQKWLREEKGKHIEINLQFLSEEKRWYWGFTILYFDNPHLISINGDYSSYEETLSEGIKAAVKILTNNKNE